MIQARQIPIIDADKIAREVVERGTETLRKMTDYFGEEILNEDGTLARKKLGVIVFSDQKKRETLNEIVHPAIRKRMMDLKEQHLANGAKTIVFDIPLLYESKLFHLVDKVLLVYVDYDTQIKRLMERDQAGEDDARRRIASQIPLEEKQGRADAIIDNSGTIEQTKAQLDRILEEWIR